MKVGDKVRHAEYGKGTIIKLLINKYDDCLVEFERENEKLDNGNCFATNFEAVGKEYCCAYLRFDEIELIEEPTLPSKIDYAGYEKLTHDIDKVLYLIKPIDEIIDYLQNLSSKERK